MRTSWVRAGAIALVAAGFMATGASAQVYKCKGSSGETVYSQNPCGGNAAPITVRGTKAATLTDAELANRNSVFKSTDLSSASISERNCISSASESIYGPSEQRISGYERQIAALNRQISTANNNLAGATYASGLRNQISGLQQSIASERSSADSLMNSARVRCADRRRRTEEAIEDRYRAKPDSSGPDQ